MAHVGASHCLLTCASKTGILLLLLRLLRLDEELLLFAGFLALHPGDQLLKAELDGSFGGGQRVGGAEEGGRGGRNSVGSPARAASCLG